VPERSQGQADSREQADSRDQLGNRDQRRNRDQPGDQDQLGDQSRPGTRDPAPGQVRKQGHSQARYQHQGHDRERWGDIPGQAGTGWPDLELASARGRNPGPWHRAVRAPRRGLGRGRRRRAGQRLPRLRRESACRGRRWSWGSVRHRLRLPGRRLDAAHSRSPARHSPAGRNADAPRRTPDLPAEHASRTVRHRHGPRCPRRRNPRAGPHHPHRMPRRQAPTARAAPLKAFPHQRS
jgi:hypothetical protein